MKKFMTVLLGLSFVLGTATVSFAGDNKADDKKEEKKGKKKKDEKH